MNIDLLIQELAERHGINEYAVRAVWRALERNGGRSAQFSHPDLGGYGQWIPGMTQIGDMSNHALRDRVTAVCQKVSNHCSAQSASDVGGPTETSTVSPPNSMKPMKPMSPMKPMEPMKTPARWWPEGLGDNPDSAGGQNEIRYAFFGGKHRLVVDSGNGETRVFNTADHRISGVHQHQNGGGQRLTFTSQHGEVDLDKLAVV